MTDTVTRLIQAVAKRDALQFPGQQDHEEYAREYILGMLRDLLQHDPDLDQYFEQRVELVEADTEDSKAWEPK